MKRKKILSLFSLAILCSPYLSVPITFADTLTETDKTESTIPAPNELEQPVATTSTQPTIEETLPSSETIPEESVPAESIPSESIPESSQSSESTTESSEFETEIPEESTTGSQEESDTTNSSEEDTETTSDSQIPSESTEQSTTSEDEITTETSSSLEEEAETTTSAPVENEPSETEAPALSSQESGTTVSQVSQLRPHTGGTSSAIISRPKDFNFNGFLGDFDASKFDFSKDVLKWQPLVEKEAIRAGLADYTVLLLAIMQVESGGRGTSDIMQSSESAGLAPNSFKDETASVRQSVLYLKNVIEHAKKYEKNYETNLKLIAQAYNYGSGFIKFVDEQADGIYNVSVAEDYSLTYLAPALGNKTGETYSYKNEFSKAFGKEYLYRNGGNFYYGNIISAYLYQEFAPVLMAVEEFQGTDYVFGGKSPISGFDCSGLVSWGLNEVDVTLASYTVTQWENTEAVDPEDAKPGDLIFFRGTYGDDPNFISHIEFYIDDTTMFGSNSSGVGYHSFDNDYWKNHFAGIRRVKELSTDATDTLVAKN